jgi:hypothetical protein
MASKIGVNSFREIILKESGGISSSNLYQFQIEVGANSALKDYFDGNLNNIGLTGGVFRLNLLCNEIF